MLCLDKFHAQDNNESWSEINLPRVELKHVSPDSNICSRCDVGNRFHLKSCAAKSEEPRLQKNG